MNMTLLTKSSDVSDFCVNILKSMENFMGENFTDIQEEKDHHTGCFETLQYWDYHLYKGAVNSRKESITYNVGENIYLFISKHNGVKFKI